MRPVRDWEWGLFALLLICAPPLLGAYIVGRLIYYRVKGGSDGE